MSSKAPRDLKFKMQIPGQTHAPWPWSKSIKTPRARPYSPRHLALAQLSLAELTGTDYTIIRNIFVFTTNSNLASIIKSNY